MANPLATILSVAMLLRYSLNDDDTASLIERSVSSVLDKGIRTTDIAAGGAAVSTSEMGDAVVSALLESA